MPLSSSDEDLRGILYSRKMRRLTELFHRTKNPALMRRIYNISKKELRRNKRRWSSGYKVS